MVNTAIHFVIFVTKNMFYEMSFTLAKKCGRRVILSPPLTEAAQNAFGFFSFPYPSLSSSVLGTAVVDPAE